MTPLASLLFTLAGEVLIVTAVGAIAERILPAVRDRRRAWCAILSVLMIVAAAELTGLRPGFRTALLERFRAPQTRSSRTFVPEVSSRETFQDEDSVQAVFQYEAPVAPAVVHPRWPSFLIGAWLIGTLAMAGRCLFSRWQLHRLVRRSEAVEVDDARDLATRLGLRIHRIQLREAEGFTGPVAFGIVRPTILLPRGFSDQHAPLELRVLLAHELAHLAARDPLWLALADGLATLLWWHPAVWWARRRLRATSEAAADEASNLVPGGRVALAEALVALGQKLITETSPAGFGVGGLKSELARRVTRLLSNPNSIGSRRLPWIVGTGFATALVMVTAAPWPGEGAKPVLMAALATLEKPVDAKTAEPEPAIEQRNAGQQKQEPFDAPDVSVRMFPSEFPSAPVLDRLQSVSLSKDVALGYAVRPTTAFSGLEVTFYEITETNRPPRPMGSRRSSAEPIQPFAVTKPNGRSGRVALPPDDSVDVIEAIHHSTARTSNQPLVLARLEPGNSGARTNPLPTDIGTNRSLLSYDASRVYIGGAKPGGSGAKTRASVKKIILPEFEVGTVSLGEAVTKLFDLTLHNDPEHIGVFMTILSNVTATTSTFSQHLESTPLLRGISLHNVPLEEALDAISKSSGIPWTIQDWGDIHFSPASSVGIVGPNTPGRTRITARLDQIVLPKFDLEPMPITEAIRDLVDAASQFDPEKRGVNIRLQDNTYSVDQNTGMGNYPSLRIGISLRGATLREALNSIVEASPQPLVWRVDEYAVILSAPPFLHTRRFSLNGDKFVKVLQPFLPAGSTNLQAGVRAFFATNGVSFVELHGTNTPPQDQSAIFFNDRNGNLFVRATLNDLDGIEKVLQRLDLGRSTDASIPAASPSEAPRYAELEALGDLSTQLRRSRMRLDEMRARYPEQDPRVVQANSDYKALKIHVTAAAGALKAISAPDSAPARQVRLDVRFVEVLESGGKGLDLDWIFGPTPTNAPAAKSGPANELLTDANDPKGDNYRVDLSRTEGEFAPLSPVQFAALLKRLETKGGVDILAAPRLITRSGQPARMAVTEEKTVVGDVTATAGSSTNKAALQYQTATIQVGPALDVLTFLEGDSARMTLTAKVTEFLGYDQPKPNQTVQAVTPGGKPLNGVVPLPHLRVRLAMANPFIKLGDTVVLRGPTSDNTVRFKDKVPVLGDIPLLGRLFRKEETQVQHKRLYVFVSPVEVDAKGEGK